MRADDTSYVPITQEDLTQEDLDPYADFDETNPFCTRPVTYGSALDNDNAAFDETNPFCSPQVRYGSVQRNENEQVT